MAEWPWQPRALKSTLEQLGRGVLSVAVTAPTGAGKGQMIEDLILHFVNAGGRVILFTDRKMLTAQTGERFAKAGIHFGYVSASHGMNTHANVLVASLQTVRSRVKLGRMDLPKVDLMIIDECHRRSFDYVINAYLAKYPGVSIVGYTASPVGLKGKYDTLVVAGNKEECRAYDALVPCFVKGMPEPDMRGVRMDKVGEYIQKGMAKRVMQCTVFGDIFDSWQEHGGQNRPTLVWAPGVPESRWIVEEFRKRGITAEHIDGDTSEEDRRRIRDAHCSGSVRVVSSYGVLREGVDWPWASYGILLQVCGAYETFVQIVGRLLRAYQGKEDAILQDHSGTWHRHGSPNFDREWSLDDTNLSIASERARPPKSGGEEGSIPICCPRCGGVRASGVSCPHCGYESRRGVRMIRTEEGKLVDMLADVAPRKVSSSSPEKKKWMQCLFRCGATGRTFRQAAAIFQKETGKWPTNFPDCYPRPAPESPDWGRKVADVHPSFDRKGRSAQYAGGRGANSLFGSAG